jgi:hypothetical protein
MAVFRESGVVGTISGGAIHERLAAPTPTLILNAVESEPGYTVDTLLLSRSGRAIAELAARFQDFGFRRVVLAVNDWTTEEVPSLPDVFGEAGVEILEVPGDEPAGDELALVHAVTGKYVEPGVTSGSIGVTVVSVESAYHMQRALVRGKPMTTKLVQIAGDVETAHVFEVPIGMAVGDIAKQAGAEPGMKALLVSASRRLRSDFSGTHVAVDGGDMENGYVEKTTDLVLVIDPTLGDYSAQHRPIELEALTPADSIAELNASRVVIAIPNSPWVEGSGGKLEMGVQGAQGASGASGAKGSHLSPVRGPARVLVRPGEHVRAGQRIAAAGADPSSVASHSSIEGTVGWIRESVEIHAV